MQLPNGVRFPFQNIILNDFLIELVDIVSLRGERLRKKTFSFNRSLVLRMDSLRNTFPFRLQSLADLHNLTTYFLSGRIIRTESDRQLGFLLLQFGYP